MTDNHLIIVAGEASGDRHAADLVMALKERDPRLTFSGLGGDLMQKAGVTLFQNITAFAVVGFWEVLRHYPQIKGAFDLILEKIRQTRPAAVILVDYPGFNLRLAQAIKTRLKLVPAPKVIYYISPQVWAWKADRVKLIKRCVDQMLVFFPFEKEFYARHGMDVTCVGHPLVDIIPGDDLTRTPSISHPMREPFPRPSKNHASAASKTPEPLVIKEDFLKSIGLAADKLTLGLLPGSRRQEIERHLPVMLESAQILSREFPPMQFLLIQAPTIERSLLEQCLVASEFQSDATTAGGLGDCRQSPKGLQRSHATNRSMAERHRGEAPVEDSAERSEAYLEPCPQELKRVLRIAQNPTQALAACDICLVASGTATLEVALHGIPMVIIYKTSLLTWLLAKMLVTIPYIGLVNVVAGKKIVPELIQQDATPQRIARELKALMTDETRIAATKVALGTLRESLCVDGAEPGPGQGPDKALAGTGGTLAGSGEAPAGMLSKTPGPSPSPIPRLPHASRLAARAIGEGLISKPAQH